MDTILQYANAEHTKVFYLTEAITDPPKPPLLKMKDANLFTSKDLVQIPSYDAKETQFFISSVTRDKKYKIMFENYTITTKSMRASDDYEHASKK